jgi:hypothetical protein
MVSDYRLEFGSIVGPRDTDRLYDLLSIVSEGDELDITMKNNHSEQADSIEDVLKSNNFNISAKRTDNNGNYHLIAHRAQQLI